MIAFPGEVDTAFKAAQKLVDEGLAINDDELRITKNIKDQKGKIIINISSKKGIQVSKPNINTISIQKNSSYDNIIKKDVDLLQKNSKLNLETQTTEIAEELHNNRIDTYNNQLKIERNIRDGNGKTESLILIKDKGNIKEYEIEKNVTNEKIVKDIKELLKDYDKIELVALTDRVGSAFTVAKVLHDEGIATFDEELKIKRNFKEGKGKTKAFISLKKIDK